MLRFFCRTRSAAGMVLASAAIIGLFFSGFPLSFCTCFLYSIIPAVPLIGKLLQCSSFRFVQILSASAAACCVFLPPGPPSALLLGCCSAAVLHLCVHTAGTLFPRQHAPVQGIFCSTILLTAMLSSLLLPDRLQLPFISGAVSSGLLLLPGRSPEKEFFHASAGNPLAGVQRVRLRRPCFYAASMSAAVCTAFLMYRSGTSPALQSGFLMQICSGVCLFLGPLVTGWFVDRKGVFSGCVLLIFLCESALIGLCFPQNMVSLLLGQMTLAAAAGGLPVVLAVLTHYLYGPLHYTESFAQLALCIPLGVILVLPLYSWAETGRMNPEETAILLLSLLILGFFCIFFAWKHRFVILKNRRI